MIDTMRMSNQYRLLKRVGGGASHALQQLKQAHEAQLLTFFQKWGQMSSLYVISLILTVAQRHDGSHRPPTPSASGDLLLPFFPYPLSQGTHFGSPVQTRLKISSEPVQNQFKQFYQVPFHCGRSLLLNEVVLVKSKCNPHRSGQVSFALRGML